MFELVDNAPQNAVIKVIGVGGGGGNAVRLNCRSTLKDMYPFMEAFPSTGNPMVNGHLFAGITTNFGT